MRRFVYAFVGLCCLIVFTLPAPAVAEDVKALTGEFTQNRYLKGFDQPLISAGVFAYSPKLGFAWITQTPFASKLIITEDTVFQEINGNTVELEGGNLIASQVSRLLIPVLANDRAAMSEDFDIKDIEQRDQGVNWAYELRPKSEGLKSFVENIVAAGGDFTDRIDVHKPGGDRDEILLSNQKNISDTPPNVQTFFKLTKE